MVTNMVMNITSVKIQERKNFMKTMRKLMYVINVFYKRITEHLFFAKEYFDTRYRRVNKITKISALVEIIV